jgi:hypothetical protein
MKSYDTEQRARKEFHLGASREHAQNNGKCPRNRACLWPILFTALYRLLRKAQGRAKHGNILGLMRRDVCGVMLCLKKSSALRLEGLKEMKIMWGKPIRQTSNQILINQCKLISK